jgi:hypothetical protein
VVPRPPAFGDRGYWLAAIGIAEVLAKVLKVALHRPRFGAFVDSRSKLSHRSRPILSHWFKQLFGYSDVDKSKGIADS